MLLTELVVDRSDFAAGTGWDLTPEGLCRDATCVPAPGAWRDGRVDVTVAAERLGMPLVHDEAHHLWALGPAGGGHSLSSAIAPELTLERFGGGEFSLSTLRGRKVIMIAWASW